MPEHDSTRNLPGNHHLTRRSALAGVAGMRRDMQTLWREFEDAEAVLDSLPDDSPDREADGLLPNSDPRVIRFEDAQERIVAARPTDLTGLVAQLRYYQRLVKDSEPNEAEAAMFDHVIDQMAVLAQQPAGPLSSTF